MAALILPIPPPEEAFVSDPTERDEPRPDHTRPDASQPPLDALPDAPQPEERADIPDAATDATIRLADDADAIPVPLIGPPALTADADAGDEDAEDDEDEVPAPNRRRTALIVAGALVLVAVGALLGLFAAQLSRPPGDDQVIARVGPTEITRGESSGEDPKALLDELIDAELVIQASDREGVKADTAELDQQIQQIREQQGDDETYKRFLAENRIPSEAALRDLLARQQLIQAMVYKHTTVEQARARHILLAGDTPEVIAQRKPEAEALLAEIQGGADFAAVAREKSEDPGSKETGGELGWAPRSAFVPAFDEAIFSMKPGELRLVQSDYGWHIIQLQDAPQVRPLDSQRYFQAPAVQQALNDTFLPWVKSLRTDAEKAGQVNVLVPPAELVPSAQPALPSAMPLDATPAPAP
jgi:peptidyl-prolyl cis-trans isomerase C